jgi:hypothetical protein
VPFINPYASPSPDSAAPQGQTASGFVNPYASAAGADVQDAGGGFSPFGFLGNIAEGVGDVVGGAVSVLGGLAQDALKLGAEVVPGEQAIESQGFRSDDIAKGLVGFGPNGEWDPAKFGISGDLWRRYSPLLPGGPPASETFRLMYEEPVSFALDALTVATGGAAAATKVGTGAVKAAGAMSTVERTVATLTQAGYGARAAGRAGVRVAMDELQAAGRLTAFESLAKSALPRVTYRRVGDKLTPAITALNPAMRPVGALTQRVMTEPIGKLSSRVDDLRGAIDDHLSARGVTLDEPGNVVFDGELAKTVADYRIAKSLLDDAQAHNVTRLATDQMASRAISRVAGRLSGELNGQFLMERQKRQGRVVNTLRPWLTAHPEIATRAAGLWQRLDVDVSGATPAHWAGRPLEFEGLGPRQVRLINNPTDKMPLRLVVDPAVRAASDPVLLKRTDELVSQLNDTAQKWVNDPKWAELGYDVADEVDSINRIVDHLNDALDRRHQADLGIEIDPALLAMDDMRLLNLEDSMRFWKDPAGQVTPTRMLDRMYLPLRAKYGAKVDLDGNMQGGIAAKDLDDALREVGEAAPIYFPHMDPSEIGAWEFFRSKKRVGGARLASDPHLKRNQAKLLERGSYITDPMEAYSRRAARAVRAEETYRTLYEFATRVGRPINSPTELGTGERLFAPEIARIAKRTEVSVQDLVDDATSKGIPKEQAIWDSIQQVTSKNQDEIAEIMAKTEAQGVSMWAVPDVAAKRLEDAARYAQGWGPKGVQMFYDSTMQAWRQLTLFTRPAYVANQFLGNTAFAILQGSGLRAPMSILARRFNQLVQSKLGRNVDDATLARMQELPGMDQLGHGLFGSLPEQYVPRNPGLEASRIGKAAKRVGESRLGVTGKRFMEAERLAAVEIDNAFRASGLVRAFERAQGVNGVRGIFRRFRSLNKRMEKVMDGGIADNPAIIQDAVREAKNFFGDYSAMGPFQRHVVRRYFFPWWGFTRHNLQLMAKFPIEFPGRAELLSSIKNMDEEYRKQFGPIPEWLDAAIPIGPPGSEVPFFSLRGGSPFEGVMAMTGPQFLGGLAPLPKVVAERTLGRNLFTDQPFTGEDYVTPYGSDQPFHVTRDEAGNVVDVQAVEGAVLPNIVEHLLRQLPPYGYAERFAAQDASTYDTTNLLELLQGEGIRRDTETGEPLDQEGRLAVLGSLMGVPINEVDLASYQERLTSEEKAALTAAIARFGGGA